MILLRLKSIKVHKLEYAYFYHFAYREDIRLPDYSSMIYSRLYYNRVSIRHVIIYSVIQCVDVVNDFIVFRKDTEKTL